MAYSSLKKILGLWMIVVFFTYPFFSFAQTTGASDLQASIDAKNAEIQSLQQQISTYQNQVNAFDNQAANLQQTLNGITQNQKVLQKNISLTSKKIQSAALTITKNQQQIGTLGQGIQSNTQALAETLRALNQDDDKSILELLTSNETVSGFLTDVEDVARVQSRLKSSVTTMEQAKQNLEQAQTSLQQKKQELVGLSGQLVDQKKVVDVTAQEKSSLLSQTRGQESTYQKMLDDTKQQVAQLNSELFGYESQLKFTLNPNSLPAEGSAPLAWPLTDVLITQRFGKTVDAKRLYVTGSHSGVDFRATIGTPVYAVADGTVQGVGNTDLTCPRASFGKWVFIVHNNGLATAYGHLSLIKAHQGEVVKAGDLIGYSGKTGHATGPHLHITVFAANGINGEEGARVAERPSAACKGKNYTMPIAPTSAYLDPLLYFPHAGSSMFKDGSGEDSSE